MEKFIIEGGRKLYGKVEVQSAKNSVLPLIAGSIMSGGKTYIENCPKLTDIIVMCEIIKRLGGKTRFDGETLIIDTENLNSWQLPSDLTCQIRASLFMVGPLICRFGLASMSMPGGCKIGERPIDIHIESLRKMGAIIKEDGEIIFDGRRIEGSTIDLRFPSVGATENLMMSAVRAKGITIIKNCAKEPEIVDLQNYLNSLGAKVKGAGSDVISVEGVKGKFLKEVKIKPAPDRIETGTFMFAVASVGGEIEIESKYLQNLKVLLKLFENNACKLYADNDKICSMRVDKPFNGFGKIKVGPYPQFPTDLQPQLVACASSSIGLTAVEENVFPERFSYCSQLSKLGAKVDVYGNLCLVEGGKLHGAEVVSGDLRGGASLVVGALSAEGISEVKNVSHIDRGYYKLEEKLSKLGAKITRVTY